MVGVGADNVVVVCGSVVVEVGGTVVVDVADAIVLVVEVEVVEGGSVELETVVVVEVVEGGSVELGPVAVGREVVTTTGVDAVIASEPPLAAAVTTETSATTATRAVPTASVRMKSMESSSRILLLGSSADWGAKLSFRQTSGG